MEFTTPKSKVYIQTDSQNHIIQCEGGYYPPADPTGWILINEGIGDRYNLCQSHYFEGGLYTVDGIPRYKYINSEVILRSDFEIEADRNAIPKIKEQPTVSELMDAILELSELVGGTTNG